MRLFLLCSWLMACGGRVGGEAEPWPTEPISAPLCTGSDMAEVPLWARKIELDATSRGCDDPSELTIVDRNANCTLVTASTKALCDGRTRVNRGTMRLVVQGKGVLPTLNSEMPFVGTEGVTYFVAGLSSSFASYLPALGPETTGAVIAINAHDDRATYCSREGVVAEVLEAPGAIVRYIGGGTATDGAGLLAIEGVAPGSIRVRLTKPGCGGLTTEVRLEAGLVSLSAGWIRRR